MAEPLTMEQFERERAAAMSSAVGMARLYLRRGETLRALQSLDAACEKTTRMHREALLAAGHPVEEVDRFLRVTDEEFSGREPVEQTYADRRDLRRDLAKLAKLADDAGRITSIGHGLRDREPVSLGSLNWANSAFETLRDFARLLGSGV